MCFMSWFHKPLLLLMNFRHQNTSENLKRTAIKYVSQSRSSSRIRYIIENILLTIIASHYFTKILAMSNTFILDCQVKSRMQFSSSFKFRGRSDNDCNKESILEKSLLLCTLSMFLKCVECDELNIYIDHTNKFDSYCTFSLLTSKHSSKGLQCIPSRLCYILLIKNIKY
jgi:hypothetical protein